MYQRISKLLIVMTMSLGLLACTLAGSQLEKDLIAEGAVRLNPAQVTDHLSGKTQVWASGGAYFLPDGTVYVKFDGRIYPLRTWTVDETGEVCIAFPNGFVSSCSAYFYKDEKVFVITLEIMGEKQTSAGGFDTVVVGNKLSEI